jgi:hypothetical protein
MSMVRHPVAPWRDDPDGAYPATVRGSPELHIFRAGEDSGAFAWHAFC